MRGLHQIGVMDRPPRWWGAIRAKGQRGVGLGPGPTSTLTGGPVGRTARATFEGRRNGCHCKVISTNDSEVALFLLGSANGIPWHSDGETAGFMEVQQCGASPNAQYSTVQYSAQ